MVSCLLSLIFRGNRSIEEYNIIRRLSVLEDLVSW
jgi:hypothetical protein